MCADSKDLLSVTENVTASNKTSRMFYTQRSRFFLLNQLFKCLIFDTLNCFQNLCVKHIDGSLMIFKMFKKCTNNTEW